MEPLCRAFEAARSTGSRLAKARAIAEGLASVVERYRGDPNVAGLLATATRLALGQPLALSDRRTTGVGYALLAERIAEASHVPTAVVGRRARALGDLGDAAEELIAQNRPAPTPGLPLGEVHALFEALASTGGRAEKHALLAAAFTKASALEAKYLVKALLGELRIGVRGGVVEEGIAQAFGAPLAEVRHASALVTDLGDVAVLAWSRRLSEARLEVGRPLAFMLASPIETVATPLEPGAFVVEDKVDGIRAQLHVGDHGVRIFGRGLEDVTVAFPEVVAAAAALPSPTVLDGELLVRSDEGRPRPFQALQPRLRKTEPPEALLAEAPVWFVAYDLLHDGEPLLALPWTARRARLDERLAGAKERILLHPVTPLRDDEPLDAQIDGAYEAARSRGHEGTMLKRKDAAYDAGARGQLWLKVKRAFATLDVVITAAEPGHGKRAGVLSDYTFAVWDGAELVEIGKAYSGLTDEEIEAMTARLEALTIGESHHGVRPVRPEIVLEVAFDGIQPSTRHRSGFALRFPRIARIRDDKRPEEADTLEAARALFAAQLESGHREERTAAPGRRKAAKKKPTAPSAQLSLFDAAGTPAKPPRG